MTAAETSQQTADRLLQEDRATRIDSRRADITRENLRIAVETVLSAERTLYDINHHLSVDPTGDRGHAQEVIIMRGQCVIEAQFELATGIKLADLKRAMGYS